MKKSFALVLSLMFVFSAFAIDENKIYTWGDIKALKKEGKIGEMRDIPCPCIWNKPRKVGTQEYEGRTWECAKRDDLNQCIGVKVQSE